MEVLRITALPQEPLAAAAAFHAAWLPEASGSGADLVLIFPPADHTHRAWRLAAVQSLAREQAPRRINAVEAESEAAIASACAYLATAPGLTGQLLSLADVGAGSVLD
jgi:hypothetical protein